MKNHAMILGFLLVFSTLSSFTLAQSSNNTEEQRNLAANNRFFEEIFDNGNFAVFDELFAADFVEHEEFPGLAPTKEGVMEFFTMFRAAFSDLNATAEMMIAKGDKVVSYITLTGTNDGEFMAISGFAN